MCKHTWQKGYKAAADEVRSSSEGQETTWHTSGGVPVAAADHVLQVVAASGGKVEGLEGNEGRVAGMWIECHEEIHLCRILLGK